MNIIGKSEVAAQQMANFVIKQNPNAKSWALEYAKLYLSEGELEGVRGDVAWYQSVKETHYFLFDMGTAVTFDQNNFCGMGVTQKGMKGNSFATPQLGIRAQIQHLKAYATSAPLVNSCIDPRYKYVNKGCAPTVEDLGGKWAVPGYDAKKYSSLAEAKKAKADYGSTIIAGIEAMKKESGKEVKFMPKVFLSAGHGGSDPGAVGNGLQEKNINLQIMLACKAELEKYKVEVACSRFKDENDPVTQEVVEANASGADIAVSFHTNAGGGDGSETFCNLNNADGKRLAELCEKHVAALGQNSHGTARVKSGTHLHWIKKTNMTSVLCECAFIDSKDVQIIDTTAEQVAFGQAYAHAILEYFGIAYSGTDKPVANTTPVVSNEYTLKDFIKEVQKAIGVTVDGSAGPKTMAATPTISYRTNRTHPVVAVLQKRLNYLGHSCGEVDGKAGPKFDVAVKLYQQKVVGLAKPDGELTSNGKSWKKLLGKA